MADDKDDKKKQQNQDSSEEIDLWKMNDEIIDSFKSNSAKDIFRALSQGFRKMEEHSNKMADSQDKALDLQIRDIMGEWASHISAPDREQLLQLTFDERANRLIALREKYETLFSHQSEAEISANHTDEIISEQVENVKKEIDDARALQKYAEKVMADLEWEYRDDSNKLQEMKDMYKQIFLRVRHERGW